MTAQIKSQSARRRRNRISTQATLRAIAPEDVVIPPLPHRRAWQQETQQRWASVFESPMAPEYTNADLYNLYDLAELWDDFTLAKDADERIKLSKEIRIKSQAFGLTPLDRRRLSWEIEKGEQAEIQTRARRERRAGDLAEDSDEDAYASLA